ncbi:unnamed protein product [Meganyctiphanes norvegica]|uniref:Fucosyltransferase n=1 Tax=Meganyctiphanes norvegica TaxID=48144 RepID=A0AAV2S5Y8_MEGNR
MQGHVRRCFSISLWNSKMGYCRSRRVHIVLLIFLALWLYFHEDYQEKIQILSNSPRWDNFKLSEGEDKSTSDKPANILFWTPYQHEMVEWNHIFGRLLNKECPVNNCQLMFNRSQIHEADAVVFSNVYMNRDNDFSTPATHPTYQFWVMLSFEGHLSFRGKHEKDTDYAVRGGPDNPVWEYQVNEMSKMGINWTMHFRRDAHVRVPYGTFTWTDDGTGIEDKDYWSTKNITKPALWMASHCHTASDRKGYVEELQKYMRVDVYGRCGKFQCGTANLVVKQADWDYDHCEQVTNEYMFYLAFENRLCADYASEKFYRSLSQDVIPVVLGGVEYDAFAPPNSYINALDFPSPKELASFLNKVASDHTLYNRYFEWKKHYTIEQGHPYKSMICNLCEKLHEVRKSPPTPKEFDLRSWIYKDGWLGTWKDAVKQKFPHLSPK